LLDENLPRPVAVSDAQSQVLEVAKSEVNLAIVIILYISCELQLKRSRKSKSPRWKIYHLDADFMVD
jgi:hypothetical protein